MQTWQSLSRLIRQQKRDSTCPRTDKSHHFKRGQESSSMLTSLRLCADYSLILVIKPLSCSGNRNQGVPSRFPAGITIYDKSQFVNQSCRNSDLHAPGLPWDFRLHHRTALPPDSGCICGCIRPKKYRFYTQYIPYDKVGKKAPKSLKHWIFQDSPGFAGTSAHRCKHADEGT